MNLNLIICLNLFHVYVHFQTSKTILCGEKRIKTSTKKERKNQHSFITGNNTTANDQLKILVIIYIFLQQRSCTHKAYQPPTTEENYNKFSSSIRYCRYKFYFTAIYFRKLSSFVWFGFWICVSFLIDLILNIPTLMTV